MPTDGGDLLGDRLTKTNVPSVATESYTMRAEREAVADAVNNVWVLAVRALEELRSLQVLARKSITLQVTGTRVEIQKEDDKEELVCLFSRIVGR